MRLDVNRCTVLFLAIPLVLKKKGKKNLRMGSCTSALYTLWIIYTQWLFESKNIFHLPLEGSPEFNKIVCNGHRRSPAKSFQLIITEWEIHLRACFPALSITYHHTVQLRIIWRTVHNVIQPLVWSKKDTWDCLHCHHHSTLVHYVLHADSFS